MICFGFSSFSQPTFYAHIDDEKVNKGSFFKVEFQLSDARGSRFTPPSFKDFKIAAGPARSYQTTVVNGKANSFESYSYTLQAIKEGDYVIQPAHIVVKGKKITTNPLHISVLPPIKQGDLLNRDAAADEDFFLVAELNRDTAFTGQQIILDYRIYTKKNIDKIDFKSLPDLSDFHWMGLHLINSSAEQVEISGETFTTKVLKRFAIFPKRGGTYDIGPARLLLMIQKPKKRGFFFDNYETRYVNSNGITLEVNAIPEDKPADYSGLVGSYTMEAQCLNSKLSTDDALTVRMRIKGNGDANRMTIQQIQFDKNLDTYDPKILNQNKDQNQKKRDHFAVIEYLYTTSKPGRYQIQPTFTYFDVDSSDFITLKSRPCRYDVSKGNGLIHADTDETKIEYALIAASDKKPNSLLVQKFYWNLVWICLLVFSLFLTGLKWYQNRKKLLAPPKSKKQLLIDQLTELKTGEHVEIAHRIEELLGDYLREMLGIEESSWSADNLSAKLASSSFSEDKRIAIVDLLERCKFAAYAGTGGVQQLSWVDEAIDLVV